VPDTLKYELYADQFGPQDFATGGTITDANGYRTHTFRSSGTFTVVKAGGLTVSSLVVGGGGGGGFTNCAGGGGAGGAVLTASSTLSTTTYSIVVGNGGAGGTIASTNATNGQNSTFNSITGVGGGFGGSIINGFNGGNGASGGGGSYSGGLAGSGSQGNNGANGSPSGSNNNGGGGGGMGGVGGAPNLVGGNSGGTGGAGATYSLGGTSYLVAAGGGGGGDGSQGLGGSGIGGYGGGPGTPLGAAGNGVSNTGSGGGGGGGGFANPPGGNGGSGIVIISYPLTPTTLVVHGSLPAGYGYTPATTTYAFTGATLLNAYYNYILKCNGANPSFSNTQQNLSSLNQPVLTMSSFAFSGTMGSTFSQPTWTWSSTSNLGIISAPVSPAPFTFTSGPSTLVVNSPFSFTIPAQATSDTNYFLSGPQYSDVVSSTAIGWTVSLPDVPVETNTTTVFGFTGSSIPGGGGFAYIYSGNGYITIIGNGTSNSFIAPGWQRGSILTFIVVNGVGSYYFNNVFVYSAAYVPLDGSNVRFQFVRYGDTSYSAQTFNQVSFGQITRGTGGVPTTTTVSLYGDANKTPTTLLETTTGDSTLLGYTYRGATVGNYYYQVSINASNAVGSSLTIIDTEKNILIPPTATLSSFAFDSTPGTDPSYPHWYWAYGGGTPTSYSWTVYGDASASPTTVLASGTTSITDYQYTGATVAGYSFKLTVSAINAGGTGTFSDTRVNQAAPGVSITAQSIGTGTSAAPSVTAYTGYANSQPLTSVTFALYQSKTSTDPGTLPSGGYTLINTYTNSSPVSSETRTFSGTTILTRYYRYLVTAVNSVGSTSGQTTSMLCSAA
jgi:hypothetical protein